LPKKRGDLLSQNLEPVISQRADALLDVAPIGLCVRAKRIVKARGSISDIAVTVALPTSFPTDRIQRAAGRRSNVPASLFLACGERIIRERKSEWRPVLLWPPEETGIPPSSQRRALSLLDLNDL
jgi:hypothetical protein